MEHRWSSREPYRGNVWLEFPRGSVLAQAQNLGPGGIRVDTGGFALPINTPVHVRFVMDDAGCRCRFHLEAMVVRRAPDGLGIMFLEAASDIVGLLQRTLYAPPAESAPGRAAA